MCRRDSGCTDELEKIHRTYAYVQQNIRYIAFENGLAGHRPDRPAAVLRKRYGDCKGMALLLRTLLKAQGFDARMAYIGTADIASSPDEVPTLAAINPAFCLLFHQGKRYCLDAPYRYLPPEDIPQGIQGRKALDVYKRQGDILLLDEQCAAPDGADAVQADNKRTVHADKFVRRKFFLHVLHTA